MPDVIFAVVWVDFGVPLHLPCDSAAEAISKAKDMHARATAASIELQHLRAVRLSEADELTTLWSAAA